MYIQIPLQAALERAFARNIMLGSNNSKATVGRTEEQDLQWNVKFKFFPHPSLAADSVVGQVSAVLGMDGIGATPFTLQHSMAHRWHRSLCWLH